MVNLFLATIPAILLCLMLKNKILYRILWGILFYCSILFASFVFHIIIFNLYYDITDRIGYSSLIAFARNAAFFADTVFIIILSIIMYFAYKRQNGNLFNKIISVFVFIVMLFIVKFVVGYIHYYILDTKMFNLIDNYVVSIILTLGLYCGGRKLFNKDQVRKL